MSLLVFLNHLLLFQTFYRYDSSILFLSAKTYFPESSSAYDTDGLKVLLADFLSPLPKILHLLLNDIFLSILLLLKGEVQLLNFLFKGFPVLTLLFLLHSIHVVFSLDVLFDFLNLLPCCLANRQIPFHY